MWITYKNGLSETRISSSQRRTLFSVYTGVETYLLTYLLTTWNQQSMMVRRWSLAKVISDKQLLYLAGVLTVDGAIELHGIHKLMRMNPVQTDSAVRHSQPVYITRTYLKTLRELKPLRYVENRVSHWQAQLYIGWQWRNFFIPYLCKLFTCHDVGQALINVCYCDITFLDIFLNQLSQHYSNDATNLHRLTSQYALWCPTSWRKNSWHGYGMVWINYVAITQCISAVQTRLVCSSR